MIRIILLTLSLLLVVGFSQGQGIVFVDSSQVANPGDGSSWAMAYDNLEDALSIAVPGDTVVVAKGTYFPSKKWDAFYGEESASDERDMTFNIPSDVVLLGGFFGTESAFDSKALEVRDLYGNASVLSGDIGVVGDSTDNTYHVVLFYRVSEATVLNGFNVINGTSDKGREAGNFGGGVINNGSGAFKSSKPTITNCHFMNNSSAVYNLGQSFGEAGGIVSDCEFINNGRCIYNNAVQRGTASPIITNCLFEKNTSTSIFNYTEGGESSPIITNCQFIENESSNLSGGIFSFSADGGECNPTIDLCTFYNNYSENVGGAIGMETFESESKGTITNCLFFGNYGDSGGAIAILGGGVSAPVIANCVFANNEAYYGGAIYSGSLNQGEFKVLNSTFYGNHAKRAGGAVRISDEGGRVFSFTNCVFFNHWAQTDSLIGSRNVNVILSHSIIGEFGSGDLNENVIQGPGNIYDTDPLFTDSLNGDLSLQEMSPAIDAGNNDSISGVVEYDIEGNVRIQGGAVDMGAYERFGVITMINSINTLDLSFYPNPTSDFMKLDAQEGQLFKSVRITSLNGVEFLSVTVDKKQEVELNVSSLVPGGYMLHVEFEQGQGSSLFFKD